MTLGAGGGGEVALSLAAILVLGVGAQWVAWRIRVPSILLLLLSGFIAGPVLRVLDAPWALDPNALFGSDLLLSLVGMSVGLILYEGGLTLRVREIKGVGRVVAFLVTTGAVVTWVIAGVAAYYLFDLDRSIAILLGAVLIVTGPTVIIPMLNHVRPIGAVGPILKWEGIVIDPIGVTAAVLVFEAILIGEGDNAFGSTVGALVTTVVIGGGLGAAAALILLTVMRRFLVPDGLQNPVSLMLVIGTYVLSNEFQAESGLLATTVMGVLLANQSRADVRHILEFKENLRVLLISALFIVLAARVRVEDITGLNWWAVLGFLAVLVLVARPLAVWLSTVGAGLSWRERAFMCVMAPRGIVAAAGASVFALGLEQAGVAGAESLVPLTFSVIVGTVLIYGIAAPGVAKLLEVSDTNPQGVLFIGAPRWARAMAKGLTDRGVRVLMVDTNRSNIRAARMEGLPAEYGNILTDGVLEDLDLRGLGRALAVTPNDEVNTLALQRLIEVFDSAGLYRLPSRPVRRAEGDRGQHTVGRRLFVPSADYKLLESRIGNGWVVKATPLSEEFGYPDYRTLYGRASIPLFVMTASGGLTIVTADKEPSPSPGDTVIGLVNPDELLLPFEDEDAVGEEEPGAA